MKKFLIFCLILLVFVGVLFFIGFGSIRIKPGEFGVVISKTNGVDEDPVMNGECDWRWQFILPTNTRLEKFRIEPVSITKTITGELPSGSLYAALFNASGSFDYKFTFSMSLTVSPENVIELLKEEKISNNEDLQEYLSTAAAAIAQFASNYYLTKSYETNYFRPESVRRSEITRYIRLDEEYPLVDLASFALTDCIIPDYRLYKELQNQGILVVQNLKADIRKIPPINSNESYSYSSSESSNTKTEKKAE